jgi:hypothetical protein
MMQTDYVQKRLRAFIDDRSISGPVATFGNGASDDDDRPRSALSAKRNSATIAAATAAKAISS